MKNPPFYVGWAPSKVAADPRLKRTVAVSDEALPDLPTGLSASVFRRTDRDAMRSYAQRGTGADRRTALTRSRKRIAVAILELDALPGAKPADRRYLVLPASANWRGITSTSWMSSTPLPRAGPALSDAMTSCRR